MMIKNSIRQLWRMRGRACLFLLLLILASGLLSMGFGFFVINRWNMKKYEDTFMTIGTVEQVPKSFREVQEWDAETKSYRLYRVPDYGPYLPVSALDFEGADYLSGPEKRVVYGAVNMEYETYGDLESGVVVEVSPLEDVVPDHPVKLLIRNVLSGDYLKEGDIIKFCDHYNPKPDMLCRDKTYVMSLVEWTGHESEKSHPGENVIEYQPSDLTSMQFTSDGERIRDELLPDGYFCDEVTDGFYGTEKGKRWLLYLETDEYVRHLLPVTGTENIYLMMPFYSGDVYLTAGRDFTPEEYDAGEKVCIVWEQFAAKYGLKIGDNLRLPLYYADHAWSAGAGYGNYGPGMSMFINAKGELVEPFEDSEYRIVGMYGGKMGIGSDEYSIGYNEVIIPSASVKNSDENNIVLYRPMTGSTTSFQIENGTIDKYMEQWSAQGIDNVEITFYDKGYTKLWAGMENMKQVSRILTVMGAVMVFMVLGYFVWLFILRERARTAVERCLGFRKRQSFVSVFSGIFLLILVGSAVGCTAGSALSARIFGSAGQTVYFDTSYGNSTAAAARGQEGDPETEVFYPAASAAGSMAVILLTGSLMAAVGIGWNLRQEPMELLGKGERQS